MLMNRMRVKRLNKDKNNERSFRFLARCDIIFYDQYQLVVFKNTQIRFIQIRFLRGNYNIRIEYVVCYPLIYISTIVPSRSLVKSNQMYM